MSAPDQFVNAVELETAIQRRGHDVLTYQRLAAESSCALARCQWRDAARMAAQDVARLVAMRSPETVARMERERGLV